MKKNPQRKGVPCNCENNLRFPKSSLFLFLEHSLYPHVGKSNGLKNLLVSFPHKVKAKCTRNRHQRQRKKPLKIVLMAKKWTKVVVMGSSTCTTEALFTSFYKVRRSLE